MKQDLGITRLSHFIKKQVGHTGTAFLPNKLNVLSSHVRLKDDVVARKGKLCWEIIIYYKLRPRNYRVLQTEHTTWGRMRIFHDKLPGGKLEDERKRAALSLFLLICTPHMAERCDSIRHGPWYANRSKPLKWVRFWIFQFWGLIAAFPYCGKHFEYP